MLNATRDLVLPTTITGSYPRPHWFNEELRGRGFKDALGDSRFREQYLDAVACLVREQEMAGLDLVTDGDSRFDLTVGGKSWFYYVIERLGGITGAQDRSTGGGWKALRPGHILYEVMEAYQPAVVGAKLAGGALQYAALFKTAQRLANRHALVDHVRHAVRDAGLLAGTDAGSGLHVLGAHAPGVRRRGIRFGLSARRRLDHRSHAPSRLAAHDAHADRA